MSEKVLGFKTKKAKIRDSGSEKYFTITLKRKGLVPVRLRKESVDLKWLEEYCEINEEILKVEGTLKNHKVVRCIRVDALLCAVRAKAKEEACEE